MMQAERIMQPPVPQPSARRLSINSCPRKLSIKSLSIKSWHRGGVPFSRFQVFGDYRSGFYQWIVWLCLLSIQSVQLSAQTADSPIQDLIRQTQPKMVKIFGASIGNVEGYSTGILVSEDGKILTSQGVYLDGNLIKVILADGTEHRATVLRRDRERQLALLKIEAKTPQHFHLEKQPVGRPGDWVLTLTNAFRVADKDEPVSVTMGVVALRTSLEARRSRRDLAYQGELVLIDCITSIPGAAGGAVVLMNGQLVGMVGKIIDSSETNTRLNYAVPAALLDEFLNSQETTTTPTPQLEMGKADLGIVVFKLGGRNNPAFVERVRRGSPAALAELKTDDLIVSINGVSVGTIKQYEEALDQLVPGEEIILIVKRGTEFLRIPLTPVERQ
jgi:S1-C subfamily serine protease